MPQRTIVDGTQLDELIGNMRNDPTQDRLCIAGGDNPRLTASPHGEIVEEPQYDVAATRFGNLCQASTGYQPSAATVALIQLGVRGSDGQGGQINLHQMTSAVRRSENANVAQQFGMAQNPPLTPANIQRLANAFDNVGVTGNAARATTATAILSAGNANDAVVAAMGVMRNAPGDLQAGRMVAEALLQRGDVTEQQFQRLGGRLVADLAADATPANMGAFMRGSNVASGFNSQYLSSGPAAGFLQGAIQAAVQHVGTPAEKAVVMMTRLSDVGPGPDAMPQAAQDYLGTLYKSVQNAATQLPVNDRQTLAKNTMTDALVLRSANPMAMLAVNQQEFGPLSVTAQRIGNIEAQAYPELNPQRQQLNQSYQNVALRGQQVGQSVRHGAHVGAPPVVIGGARQGHAPHP